MTGKCLINLCIREKHMNNLQLEHFNVKGHSAFPWFIRDGIGC